MGTRARLSVAIGAIIICCAVVGVSRAAASPDPSASMETVVGSTNQATPTPGHRSTVSDELIYDFVGPNTTDSSTKVRER